MNSIKYILFILVLLLLVTFTGFKIYKYNTNVNKMIFNSNTIINPTGKNNYEEELNSLRKEYNNNDIIGILSIDDTSFNEIVMQSTDNDYYLNHTVYHESNWRGQTFLDYRTSTDDNKLIIYGHNSNYYNLPFKIFESYYDISFYNKHKYIYLQTSNNINKYLIFSVYVEVEDWDYYNKIIFSSKEEYYNHILSLKNKSMYETNVNVEEDDSILIIQTCSTKKEYSKYNNKYLLVIAKKVV